MANFRVEPTCPHRLLEPVRVKINNGGFQSFCVACHELVAWSTNDEPRERTVEEQNLWVYDKLQASEYKKNEFSESEKLKAR